ncbi:MAG: hypothetical protein V7670_14135 [Maribacter arcticus]|uniref:5' nucleotidase, NT5C type n=1 Tax=Maribacter arcticus TaxID=561365 RepID=UPI0030027F8E
MRKRICIDMDDVLCDYTNTHTSYLKENPKQEYPQSVAGFFKNLPEIEGAISAVNNLNSIEKFQVYILTAPSEKNPLCYTEKRIWVQNHLGFDFVKRLIISSDKGLIKGDYLIDDYIEGKGQENFEGILLQFGSKEFPDWKTILNYFNTKY